ncbi:Response regulator receiver domain-containing protein [Rhodoblastus acidophilus]|uniref:Response regulator receiver domain-containing protein n=1 Tax=Rhodoblastus acidophilus TaxID=1074 RepID=A0A212RFG8_RHOAC|nr:response regulator [Rhodoblastus acidophilus]PPQ39665.1 hypothetical protein CKO16_05395 [Rhodoblastus acidophilus]RAI24447.1 hypothetical protein CH337_00775 [Rhodoblastus acidophilus]SNB71072.1 Response regulator receiver domain-containing protein [Rhodoblastus acidophilus]
MNSADDSARVTRALVIDDDLIQRRLIAKTAVQAGHETMEACSVTEAEARFSQARLDRRPFDCVTVDLGLTDGLGADLLHMIVETCPDAKVLIVTGASKQLIEDTRKIAQDIGIEIAQVFIKPIDLPGLRETLRQMRRTAAASSAA